MSDRTSVGTNMLSKQQDPGTFFVKKVPGPSKKLLAFSQAHSFFHRKTMGLGEY
jgi:hypothetical protein